MSAPRAVVFDLDGTLVDSGDDIAAAANHALRQHDLPELPAREIAGYVGDGARRLMARAARMATDSPGLDPLLTSFLEYYEEHPAEFTRPVAGAEACLAALHPRLPLALCTNKPAATTLALLQALGWTALFRTVVAGGDTPTHKPDPAPLLLVAKRLGVPPADLVMVGDGPQDIECGHAVGCSTVAVPGTLMPVSRLLDAKPHHVLGTLAELPRLLSSGAVRPQLARV